MYKLMLLTGTNIMRLTTADFHPPYFGQRPSATGFTQPGKTHTGGEILARSKGNLLDAL